MAGLKRRVRVEGWAQDVTNGDEAMSSSFLQRLGDNNRLWVGALIVLVVVAGLLVRETKQKGALENEDLYKPPPSRLVLGTYGDNLHKEFAADFVRSNESAISAHFTDDGKFVVTVLGDTSADDIEHMSRMAAERNAAKFRNRVVVETYQRSAAAKADELVCVTKWEMDRYGFVPKFIRHDK